MTLAAWIQHILDQPSPREMAPLVPYLLVAIVGDMVGLIALGVSAQLDRWSASDVGTSANLARARATNRLLSEGKGTALDIAIDKDQERKSDKLETRAKRVNRGGFGISDRGISGFRAGRRNRRDEIYEEAET